MKEPKTLRLSLDTTIPNFVYALDSPERMMITRRFMLLRRSQAYEMVISAIVIDELMRAPESKRELLLAQVDGLELLQITPEAEHLARLYIRNKILPARSLDDARHVAVATLHRVDALVSWNFGHLVNVRRTMAIHELHALMGLHIINIVTPEEVLG